MYCWLRRAVAALVVAGGVLCANAAMTPTLWTDEAGFLSRMIDNHFFTQVNPSLTAGFTDPLSEYGYSVGISKNSMRLTFASTPEGLPTGVGGYFNPGTTVRFTFFDGFTSFTVPVTVGSSGFAGYTTDVDPADLAISSIVFPISALPSKLHVGLDLVAVPEVSTVVAGALLIIPFAASTVRSLRRKH